MSKVNFRNTPKVPKNVKVEFYQKMDPTKEKKRCLLCGDEIEDTDPHYLVEKSWEPDNIVGLLCRYCGPSVSGNIHDLRSNKDTPSPPQAEGVTEEKRK